MSLEPGSLPSSLSFLPYSSRKFHVQTDDSNSTLPMSALISSSPFELFLHPHISTLLLKLAITSSPPQKSQIQGPHSLTTTTSSLSAHSPMLLLLRSHQASPPSIPPTLVFVFHSPHISTFPLHPLVPGTASMAVLQMSPPPLYICQLVKFMVN